MNDLIQVLEKSVTNYSLYKIYQSLQNSNLEDWQLIINKEHIPPFGEEVISKVILKKENRYNQCEITCRDNSMHIMFFHFNDLQNTYDKKTNAFVYIQTINKYTWSEVKTYLSKLA